MHVIKPRGHRPKYFDHQLAYRIDAETHAELKARALSRRITTSELIRQYIEWGLENDQMQNRA